MTGSELRVWRAERRLTQTALAAALGVSPLSIKRWEADRWPAPPWLHLALCGYDASGLPAERR